MLPKTHILLLPALLLLPAAGAGHALVTVTLDVDATAYPLDSAALPAETKTCAVQVLHGADGVDMLNQAVLDGCILGWTASAFPGVDPTNPRGWLFVDSLDGRRAVCDPPVYLAHCTFWSLSVDGSPSGTGIGGWRAQDGDVYGFTYDRTFAGVAALP
jgi:hypothetical protein